MIRFVERDGCRGLLIEGAFVEEAWSPAARIAALEARRRNHEFDYGSGDAQGLTKAIRHLHGNSQLTLKDSGVKVLAHGHGRNVSHYEVFNPSAGRWTGGSTGHQYSSWRYDDPEFASNLAQTLHRHEMERKGAVQEACVRTMRVQTDQVHPRTGKHVRRVRVEKVEGEKAHVTALSGPLKGSSYDVPKHHLAAFRGK